MKSKLIKTAKGYSLLDNAEDVIATTQDEINEVLKYKLSLKNCEAIELGYDLDELACSEIGIDISVIKHIDDAKNHDNSPTVPMREAGAVGAGLYHMTKGFELGFKKALEILGDKKFSEGDVMIAWDAGLMSHSICYTNYFEPKRGTELKAHRKSYLKHLKPLSLQQTEWDVEVEMECGCGGKYLTLNGVNSICCGDKKPKLDANGCLILKRI